MTKLFGGTLHSALVHAATEYDRREEAKAARSKRGYHNPYALAQYLARIEEVETDIAAGASTRDALTAAFTGRLLNHMLKAVNEDGATDAETRGRYVYQPVKAET